MWAVYQGLSNEIVECILQFNPDVDLQDNTGFTAMHWAISSNQIFTITFLIKAKANKTIMDISGKNPEAIACERGQLKEYRVATRDPSSTFNTRFTDVHLLF